MFTPFQRLCDRNLSGIKQNDKIHKGIALIDCLQVVDKIDDDLIFYQTG